MPPTTELLGDSKATNEQSAKRDKEICSNASDYGSEDTFISLGTKIKAKAQGSKPKNPQNTKNILKYRNIAKRGRKAMDSAANEDRGNDYGLEIKITERKITEPRTSSPNRARLDTYRERSLSPPVRARPPYESYFIPLESKKVDEDALVGRVSFGATSIQSDVEQAIDTYSRRLTLTKQQLSLVEEESMQDIENNSQHMSSLSPENSLGDPKKDGIDENLAGRNTYVVEVKDVDYLKTQNFLSAPRTYTNFYDDFRSNSLDTYNNKISSTVIHTDSSSKDSGYPESGANDDKGHRQIYSLPTTSELNKSSSHTKIEEQPKSLDSVSTNSNEKGYHKTFPLDKKRKWTEPLNHSRLLYKDFFLQKEGHIALPPNNSPINSNITCQQVIPGTSEIEIEKTDIENENFEYPSYLLNSTTKAYTSKVIEDYKKELQAINNLHELTLKDIKTDAISPTPLNIDKMFEQHTTHLNDNDGAHEIPRDAEVSGVSQRHNKNSLDTAKTDISKVSSKELIQNYLKVKEDYNKDNLPKNLKKFERKVTNTVAKLEANSSYKQELNNKNTVSAAQQPKTVNIKNQTQKNVFTLRTPMSARIDSVQNDKDIDSWMSLSAPSPRVLEIDNTDSPVEENTESPPTTTKPIEEIEEQEEIVPPPLPNTGNTSVDNDSQKSKQLKSTSTVLDIYSMLKEIESYGDNPVTSVVNSNVTEVAEANEKSEDKAYAPKDNFM